MGRRVELFLILAIAIVVLIPFGINIKNSQTKASKIEEKSSEINNFIEYEINATNLQHTLRATRAQEVNAKWHLQEPNITTDKIKSLSSNSSIVSNKNIIFTENVVAIKRDGTVYKSNKAIYNTKNRKLTTPDKFTITRKVDIVTGKELNYNAKTKVTKAKNVKGTFVLKKAK